MGSAQRMLHHQDRSLIDLELSLFGVFDGVGQFRRSGEAAQLALETIVEVCRSGAMPPLEALVAGCVRADARIAQGGLGATTATLAWIVGGDVLYVSVGDSRLYCQKADDPAPVQVTVDEGEGNILDNALGLGSSRGRDRVAPQHGKLRLEPPAKLLLVTDGVTGDFAPDLLTDVEVGLAVSGRDPQRAAERLVDIARKRDDRTALVIFAD
ncbi:MAG: protein phosphatase 2C domain-containing protein [Candidatus Dormiibacterota bacterium]